MERPAGVTVIAVLNFLRAAVLILVGGFFAIGGGIAEEGSVRGVMILVGAAIVALGGVYVLLGVSLLRLRAWARLVQIILSCIGLLGIPIGTIINGIILYYLFQQPVKAAFAGLPPPAGAKSSSAVPILVGAVVLAVVAVPCLGIVAAIAVPNFLDAVGRGKQKRTLSDLREAGTALESYAIDHGTYPETTSLESLRPILEPTYIAHLPTTDGWGHPLRYDRPAPSSYVVRSAGQDGIWEHEDPADYPGGAVTGSDADLVFANGTFVRYPETAPQ